MHIIRPANLLILSRNYKYSCLLLNQLSSIHVSAQIFHVVSEVQLWPTQKLPVSIRESDGQVGTAVLTLQ